MFICWFVCLSVFFLSATRHLSTLRRCLRVLREQPSRRGRPRAPRGQACAQREHARACRTTSQRKNRCADIWCLSKTKPYARACCRIRDWWDFQKENQHATSQVQFTVCLLLECLLFESYWIVFFTNRVCWPHGITENQATYLHCGGEARAKKRARPPATCRKASTAKTGRPGGMWSACGVPKPVPRSTKTTIMTVHVNPIMQAAPSQRRIISIIQASNQLLLHSQKLFFVEWIWWRINISLKSCSRSKKLQPGGKPNSFAFRNPGRPRRLIYCSQSVAVSLPEIIFRWVNLMAD